MLDPLVHDTDKLAISGLENCLYLSPSTLSQRLFVSRFKAGWIARERMLVMSLK
jgi:hypothetical protein